MNKRIQLGFDLKQFNLVCTVCGLVGHLLYIANAGVPDRLFGFIIFMSLYNNNNIISNISHCVSEEV